jgi:hypothetical protein
MLLNEVFGWSQMQMQIFVDVGIGLVRLSGDVGDRLMIVEQRFHRARPIMQHDNGLIP